MLPIYFFTVFFCVCAGVLFSGIENGMLLRGFADGESFLQNKTFQLTCAIVAILLAIIKIFFPVKANVADGTMYLIGDLFPVLNCTILFGIFSYRYLAAIGKADSFPSFVAQINEYSVIIGYISCAIGVLHLFFAQAILF